MDRGTPDPRPPGPGPDPVPPSPTPDPMPLAAGPESATHLVGTGRAHSDRADGLRGDHGDLRRAARRDRRERAQEGPDPGRTNCPRWRAASFALSKLVVKEKAESWMRRPFVDEQRRKPKGRRLRYAVGELLTVHALHGRLERARARGPAPALAGRRADGLHRARRERRKRRPAGTLLLPVRARDGRGEGRRGARSAPAPSEASPEHDRHVMLRTATSQALRRLGCTSPGVPGRVTYEWAATHRRNFAPFQ